MAEFCSGPDTFWWWQAEAWAGKSALMSEFVLSPQAGVAVVCFFVTARYAGQDDSTAVAASVLQQLEELTAVDAVGELAALADRTAVFRQTLRATARYFHDRAQCLVLAIDGLDEDQSASRRLPSIASMLPRHPEPGLKILVSSRPHPGIPPDVPPDHPLRDPGVVHPLAPSPYARVLRDAAVHELKDMLNGTLLQRQVIGLVAAVGGGLSTDDLVQLTGAAPFDVREILTGAGGRSFAVRPSAWSSPPEEVYLLAHDTLQLQAAQGLGESELSGYRDRLHEQADRARSNGWPTDTPDYLLRGYFQILRATGDMPRLVACATDAARHELMSRRSGTDAAALDEVAAAQELLIAHEDPDLVAMALIAAHRDDVAVQYEGIPVMLPAAWARMGQVDRGESLARSILLIPRKIEALSAVARASWAAGEYDRAIQIADDAESLAMAMHPYQRDFPIAAVAEALAATGRYEHASELIASVNDPERREEAQARAAMALSVTAAPAQADRLARSVADSRVTSDRLAETAKEAAARSSSPSVTRIAETANAVARAIDDWHRQAVSLASSARNSAAHSGYHAGLAAAVYLVSNIETWGFFVGTRRLEARAKSASLLAEFGLFQRAARLAELVLAEPDSRWAGPQENARIKAEAVGALAVCGLYERAEAQARAIAVEAARAEALARIALAMALDDINSRAAELATEAESLARSTRSSWWRQAAMLVNLSSALAESGFREQAENVAGMFTIAARSLSDRWDRTISLAYAAALAGESRLDEQAARLADEAEAAARSCPEDKIARALSVVSEVLAGSGLYENAERAVRSIASVEHGSRQGEAVALAEIAAKMASTGKLDEARRLAAESVEMTDKSRSSFDGKRVLAKVAPVLAAVGQYKEAESTARLIEDEEYRAHALADVAAALGKSGSAEDAERLAEEAEALALSLTDQEDRAEALAHVTAGFADAGLYLRAESTAKSITDPVERDSALRHIADTLSRAGEYTRAYSMARAISDPDNQASALSRVANGFRASGEIRYARRVMAHALAVGPWQQTVNVLGSLCPEALTALAVKLTEELAESPA